MIFYPAVTAIVVTMSKKYFSVGFETTGDVLNIHLTGPTKEKVNWNSEYEVHREAVEWGPIIREQLNSTNRIVWWVEANDSWAILLIFSGYGKAWGLIPRTLHKEFAYHHVALAGHGLRGDFQKAEKTFAKWHSDMYPNQHTLPTPLIMYL